MDSFKKWIIEEDEWPDEIGSRMFGVAGGLGRAAVHTAALPFSWLKSLYKHRNKKWHHGLGHVTKDVAKSILTIPWSAYKGYRNIVRDKDPRSIYRDHPYGY